MGTFLQIIGGLFLLVVVAALIGLWLLKRYLGKIGKALIDASGGVSTPSEVTLVEVINQDWTTNSKVDSLTKEFDGMGFIRGAACKVKEIQGLWVYPLSHPQKSVYAVVYDYPQVGVWFDLVARYTDDTSATYSTSTMGHQMDHRPGHDKHYDSSSNPAQLMNFCVSGHRGRLLKQATSATFKDDFETAYREETEWRNGRGGPTEEEIRRVAEGDYDEDTITSAHAVLFERAKESLEETLLKRFLDQAAFSVSEWEQVRDRIVIIHERLSAEEVEEEVCDWADAECEPPLEGESSRIYMQRINAKLSPDEQFRKVGEVLEPVHADFYVAPN